MSESLNQQIQDLERRLSFGLLDGPSEADRDRLALELGRLRRQRVELEREAERDRRAAEEALAADPWIDDLGNIY